MDGSESGLTELGDRLAEAQDVLRSRRRHVDIARAAFRDRLEGGEVFAGGRRARRLARRAGGIAALLLLALAALLAMIFRRS